MGEEGETKENPPTLQFPVLPLTTTMDSPEHPLQTRASVPFKWEEQPGKPRPCTDIIVRPEPVRLILELPPCRKQQADEKAMKTPSPTAVLDGPYNAGRPKFSSFRLLVHETVLESPYEEGGVITMEGFVERRKKKKKKKGGLFGKFSRKKEGLLGGEGSFGFSSSSRFSPFSTTTSCEESDQESSTVMKAFDGGNKLRRNGSFSDGLLPSRDGINRSSSSRFLASIYEGLKQVVHWNSSSRKSSKETHI